MNHFEEPLKLTFNLSGTGLETKHIIEILDNIRLLKTLEELRLRIKGNKIQEIFLLHL